ncbi:hypothetical protein FSB84_06045 [Pseudobacter ginsenosidimutans]|uniref:hypothetical protein n=1 Tax=Pseudobacter ginsenosidimutans TaxID=661488 RepID=UPI0011BBE153|nr:hypothetical protein [Pseudobacter ginsenosidimutans]QEC41273.1 hypothetical protein FSB84_06045 [Pseudobacter ginsenosidimutans]
MGSQKNQEIALLWKFLDGTITEEESYALSAYMQSGAAEKDPEFENVLQQVYLQSSNAAPMSKEAAKRVLQRLLRSIQQQLSEKYPAPVHRVHLLNIAWFRYAAAAVLVLSVSLLAWLLISKDHKKENTLPVVAAEIFHQDPIKRYCCWQMEKQFCWIVIPNRFCTAEI